MAAAKPQQVSSRRQRSRRARIIVVLVTGALLVGPALDAAPPARSRLRLPNLVPLAPQTFFGPSTETDPNYVFGGGAVVDGCTPDEIARKLARRCLRFETILANVGAGAFEVAYTVDPTHGVLAAHQRIYRANGRVKDRFATETEFHPTHAHFHIRDFYLAHLWRVDKRGRAVGRRPVASSDKNGFCPQDSTPVEPSPSGGHYTCGDPERFGSEGALQVVGISAGWADIYYAELPDQYIEISGVRDGLYLFELEIDPHDVFVETSERDNDVCVMLKLKDGSAASWGRPPCP